jgi:2-polyprenyl-3-methyl-5-hydroxy-6-metoxy-1,4-benzoquinol methylase
MGIPENETRSVIKGRNAHRQDTSWDHSTHQDFYEYYANESQSEAIAQRFRSSRATVLRVAAQTGMNAQLIVADIGCGAGTQSRLWAESGHRVAWRWT